MSPIPMVRIVVDCHHLCLSVFYFESEIKKRYLWDDDRNENGILCVVVVVGMLALGGQGSDRGKMYFYYLYAKLV